MNTQHIADVYMSWYNRVTHNKTDNLKKSSDELGPDKIIIYQHCGLTSVRQKQSG